MKKINVLSYNIHKGFNLANRNFVLHKIRDTIRTHGSDIVFLQEVIGLMSPIHLLPYFKRTHTGDIL